MNFATSFDLPLVLTLCAIATVCKLAGCALGARIGGLAKRQSLAIGAALNARGAMEIVLGLLALQSGIIGERMFVALVVMAMFTSMSSGLAIQRLLFREAPLRFTSFMTSRTFVPRLRSRDPTGAIGELAHAAFAGTPVDPSVAAATILSRGRVRLTGMSSGIALPHARLAEIISPIVAVGLSSEGIDFDSPEGRPCHLVALILAPVDDDTALLDIFADVSRTFKDRARVKRTDGSKDFTELLSFVNTIREEDRPV